MQTRRQFVVRAGTVAASAILSPSALAAGLGSARPAALARGGRFSDGVMSGEPTPSAITLWTRLADAEGRVSLDLEVATTRTSATWSPTSGCRPPRPSTTTSSRGSPASRPTSSTTTASRRRPRTAPSGASAPRCRPTRCSPCASPSGPARTTRTATTTRTRRWRARTSTSSSASATTSTTRPTTRSRTARASATTRSAAPSRPRARPASTTSARPRRSTDYREKYSLYRSDESLRKVQARFPTVMLWDDHEVQDNYAGGAPDGGLPPEPPLLQEAPGGRLQGLLRDDALLAAGRRAQPHLPAAAVRAHRRPADHGPAPVPRQPAVRRRDRRAGVRGLRPAAHVPGHAPDELAQDASSTARRPPGRCWPTR